jgi:flagellar biosynthesis protein FlhF
MEYIEETFEAPTPTEAYELAKIAYQNRVKLVGAKQKIDRDGKLTSQITVKVPAQISQKSAVDFVYNLLIKRGLDKEWLLNEIKLAPVEYLSDEKMLLNHLIAELDKSIFIKREELDRKKVLMVVGTTGVGKSTNLVKLAGRYSYMLEKELKVAILNLDTYKVGAYEQLEIFANTLLIDYFAIESVEDLKKRLDRLRDYDIILADTAGISTKDLDRLIKQIEFIKELKDFELDIELVIPAYMRYKDIIEVYDYFSFLDISGVIITKIDETSSIGDLVSFLAKTNLPVSYLSFGQNIPNDLTKASKSAILDYFVGDKFNA